MSTLNIQELKSAMIAEGKVMLVPSVKIVATFDTIALSDACQRRAGNSGEYLLIRDVTTGELLPPVGLATATPESCTAFRIDLMEQTKDYIVDGAVIVPAGKRFFKAYGIVREAE